MSSYVGVHAPGLIKPIARPGEKVLIYNSGKFNLYLVDFLEPMTLNGELVKNFGALAAGAQSAVTGLTDLDMNYGELGQYRFRITDDMQVTFYQPSSLARRVNMNNVMYMNSFTMLRDPDGASTETFIFEQNRIYVQAMNPRSSTLAQSRLEAWGFRYVLSGAQGQRANASPLKPIKTFDTMYEAVVSNERFTVVPVSGLAAA